MGVWPDRLAEGFISLVPKGEGAEALQLRPLSVLPTIYRLWAGLRLGDAMKWQEKWIHKEAYGFRTGRSATDAAALLQTLLELARITGLRVTGYGLDYKKCFDLVPQRIALRLAKEFGMNAGVLRAARAMYKQLRRAFKIAGCLGEWLRATNGILQGCPLSVIFINLLTTVWKREIDSLKTAILVKVQALPPTPPPPVERQEGRQQGAKGSSAARRSDRIKAQCVPQVCAWMSCGQGIGQFWYLTHAHPCLCSGGATLPRHPVEELPWAQDDIRAAKADLAAMPRLGPDQVHPRMQQAEASVGVAMPEVHPEEQQAEVLDDEVMSI